MFNNDSDMITSAPFKILSLALPIEKVENLTNSKEKRLNK